MNNISEEQNLSEVQKGLDKHRCVHLLTLVIISVLTIIQDFEINRRSYQSSST